MRSTWKGTLYTQPSILSKGSLHFKNRTGFFNPYLLNSRVAVYNGNKFRLFKIRKEMSFFYLKSFVLCRPRGSHIRTKFSSMKKSTVKKK
jgi:ribosomal protein S19